MTYFDLRIMRYSSERRGSTMKVRALIALALCAAFVGCTKSSTTTLAGTSTSTAQSKSNVVQATVGTQATEPVTTTTTLARAAIQIVKSGFTQLPPDSIGNSYLSYASVLRNPNTDWIANSVSVNLTFTDNAGTVVKSKSESISVILPGQTVAVGDSTQAESASKLDVQVLVNRWQSAPSQAVLGSFSSDGVSTTARSYDGLKTNATVTSRFTNDIKDSKGVAVYYDAGGAIIGGAYTFIDFVPGGGKVGVEITSLETVPKVAKTEVYVVLTNLSLSPP